MSWSNSLILRRTADAVGIGQPVVEQHQVDAFGELLQRGLAGIGLEHVVPLGLEALGQRPANQASSSTTRIVALGMMRFQTLPWDCSGDAGSDSPDYA